MWRAVGERVLRQVEERERVCEENEREWRAGHRDAVSTEGVGV